MKNKQIKQVNRVSQSSSLKRIILRGTAFVLAALMVVPTAAFAAEEQKGTIPITYDESIYVTMDHYGNQKDLSVVKGVELNGNKTFTDYGFYKNVQNMSGYDKPTVTPDGATWNLENYEKSKLYFECTLENEKAVSVPWDFNITYKLNGVPTKAEDLPGKNGLVEINAQCIANTNVSEYIKNNMMLQLVSLVDTDSVQSIEAPGAQIQALGKYKAVLFAALPGESITFTMRIGSEHFSTLGLIMLIEPATLSQMAQFKELRALKETIGDAPAVLLDGMGSMLQSVKGMSDNLGEAGKGVIDLKDAYSTIKGYSGDIKKKSLEAITAFSAVSHDLSELVPYVETAGELLVVLQEKVANLKANAENVPAVPPADAPAKLQSIVADVKSIQKESATLTTQVSQIQAHANKVTQQTDSQSELTAAGSKFGTQVKAVGDQTLALQDQLAQLGTQGDQLQQLLASLAGLADLLKDPAMLDVLAGILTVSVQVMSETERVITNLSKLTSSTSALFGTLTNAISASSSSLNAGVTKVLDGLEGAAGETAGLSDATDKLQGVGGTLQTAIDKVMNQFTEGNNMLNIDTNAKRQSLTSEKNSSPSSVQIVLRTETIGVELMKEEDTHKNVVAQTPWARIEQVFKKIWNAIQTLFE